MSTLTFADTHNMFWATAKAKTVNGVHQRQALIDKKKLIIAETSIRSDLHLEDARGTDCLLTATIIEELAWMGAKSTAWNEFSSTMSSLIICLATNQRFNLSKYIFDAMVKHLDGGVKFRMYSRFLQVFINQQLGDMSHHKQIYVNPSHTKKIFANMKREGKDFSRRITPLFDTMMAQASEKVSKDSDHPTDSNQIPIFDQPSTSSPPKKKQKSKRKQRKEEKVARDEIKREESVLDLEKAKSYQANEIASLKKRVDKLENRRKFRTTGLKRLKKVGAARRIKSSNDINETQERHDEDLMFDTGVLDGDDMFVDATTGLKDRQSTKTNDSTAGEAVTTAVVGDSVVPTIPTTVEETLAQTLMEIKVAKPKAKGIIFHDLEK
ncbi:hypothetical protein Tco_1432956, partial [Tanacetum coccineum]